MSDCEECLSSDCLHIEFCLKKDILKRDTVSKVLSSTFYYAAIHKICPANAFLFALLGGMFPYGNDETLRARFGSLQLRSFRIFIRSIFSFYENDVSNIPNQVGTRILHFCMRWKDVDYLRLALLHGFGVFGDHEFRGWYHEGGFWTKTPRQYWILNLDGPIFDEFARYEKYTKEYRNTYMALVEFALGTKSLDLPVLLTVQIANWLNSLNTVFIAPVKLISAWKVAKRVKHTSYNSHF